MDAVDFRFLNRRIEGRLMKMQALLRVEVQGRGSQLPRLLHLLLRASDDKRRQLINDFDAGNADERRALGRSLQRLYFEIEIFHMLRPFIRTVGRRDLPVGLMWLIDELIRDLLPKGADPVVRLDDRYMYSTMDLVRRLDGLMTTLGVTFDEVSPVAFNVPETDPANALLAPILAHEVGHEAVEQADLGSAVLDLVDRSALDDLFNQCLSLAPGAEPGRWQLRLVEWLDELLCDAIAAALTGPSFLFASAAFLPPTDPSAPGTHPYSADRLALTIAQMEELGWGDLLRTRTPEILQWLSNRQVPGSGKNPLKRFLRGAVSILKPHIAEVAKSHVARPLSPADLELDLMIEHIKLGVPPIQIVDVSSSTWGILAAAWFHKFEEVGDGPPTIVEAVEDHNFNEFVTKSVEMAGVSHLWERM